MQVFISHKKDPDGPFAERLHDELRRVRGGEFDPILDEKSLIAGQSIGDQLARLLRIADVMVLIVSKQTFESAWVFLEQRRFQGRPVVVLRLGLDDAAETRLQLLSEGRLWLKEDDTRLLDKLRIGLLVERARKLRVQSPASFCDRKAQWNYLLKLVRKPGSSVELLLGPTLEGVERLQCRIEVELPVDLKRTPPGVRARVERIEWDGSDPEDLFAALAERLRADPGTLKETLSVATNEAPLIILLNTMNLSIGPERARRLRPALDALALGPPSRGIRLVQPVCWDQGASWWTPFASWYVKARVYGHPFAAAIPPLKKVSIEDVVDSLAQPGGIDDVLAKAEEIVSRARTSHEVFIELDEELRKVTA